MNTRKGFTRQNSRWKVSGGFTIIEILIVIGIMAVIGLALGTFQRDLFVLSSVTGDELAAQHELRMVFKKIVTELRPVAQPATGAYPIALAEADALVFYSDIDYDGTYERVRYFLDSGSFKKGIIIPSGNPLSYNPASETVTAVVSDVTNGGSIFSYYDETYTGTESPLSLPVSTADIRLIKMTLTVDHNLARSPGPITEESQVVIRSLKDNL